MNLKELTDLISIRQYVSNSIGNASIDRATVHYMSNTLLLLDKKIIDLLKSSEFKEYINYNDVGSVVRQAAELSNIKSGIKHKL